MTASATVEPIVNKIMESFTSSPTIRDLIEEVVNLIGQQVISENNDAKALLTLKYNQISYRTGSDPLEIEEQEFYNICQSLIDRQGRVNEFALSRIRDIDLGETIEKRTITGLTRRLERQEDRMGALIERTERLLRGIEKEQFGAPHMTQDHYNYSKPYEVYETVFEALEHSCFKMSSGAKLDKEGIWHLNNSRVTFFNCHLLPETDFIISLFFKTSQSNCGLFSIAGGDNFDRNLCLKNGQPNHRLYHEKKWKEWTGTAKNQLNDGRWHKWELVVLEGKGQIAYIDEKKVGENSVNRSHFDWKSNAIIGFSPNGGVEFVGKMKRIMISAIRRHEVVFSAFERRAGAELLNACYKEGSWHIEKNGTVVFDKMQFLSNRNFKISFCFKTTLGTCGKGTVGLMCFYNGVKDYDRNFCLQDGKPYMRLYGGACLTGSTNKSLSDNNWHKWDFVVTDGSGQKAYIDGELIGEHPHNHADFTKKNHIGIGFSFDQSASFVGKIKNVLVYAL